MKVTMEIAAWVICRTSTHATADPSAQFDNWITCKEKTKKETVMRIKVSYTHLCPRQEDVRTSHHALDVMHQGLLFPLSHIQGLVSSPEVLIKYQWDNARHRHSQIKTSSYYHSKETPNDSIWKY